MTSGSSHEGGHRASNQPAAPSSLSNLESEVMETFWSIGEMSVRNVMDALNAGLPRPRAYTTYMTILVRLEAKGVLRRQRKGKTDCYSPVFSRTAYQQLRAESEIDAIVRDYGEVALTQFARRIARLDPQRRAALEHLARAEPDESDRNS